VHVSLDWEMSAVCALMDIFCNLSHAMEREIFQPREADFEKLEVDSILQ
jgi:hypothetical protein